MKHTDGSKSVPDGWTEATLGDIGLYHNGRGFKKSEWSDHGRPIIRIQNLTSSDKPFNYYEGDDVDERNVVRENDILVSWAATLDVFRWRGPEAVLNQHIFKVESFIDADFHFYLLKRAVGDLIRQTHGSGMVHITRDRFLDTQVWLPPKAEQERIAAAIEYYLAELSEGEDSIAQAERRLPDLRAAFLLALCSGRLTAYGTGDVSPGPVGLPRLPKGWRWVRLEELAADEPRAITDGPFGSNLKTSHYTEAGPRVIRLQNIGEDEFLDAEAHISAEHFERLRAHEARPGDVVIAALGESLPRACVVPDGLGPAIVKADCPRVRLRQSVDARYVSAALNSPLVRVQGRALIAGIGRPRLNLGKLRRLLDPCGARGAAVGTRRASRASSRGRLQSQGRAQGSERTRGDASARNYLVGSSRRPGYPLDPR